MKFLTLEQKAQRAADWLDQFPDEYDLADECRRRGITGRPGDVGRSLAKRLLDRQFPDCRHFVNEKTAWVKEQDGDAVYHVESPFCSGWSLALKLYDGFNIGYFPDMEGG
jgi:hypothetical protein